MMNLDVFQLHIIPLKTGSFFIYALDKDSEPIEPYHWQQQLFLWHEESFFGSFLEKKPHNEIEGIVIDSYGLLTLLGHERFSTLAQWDWREPGDAMLAVAPVMLEAIKTRQLAA